MTEVIPLSEASLRQAATLLQSGRLVAFPTETVYGLGGNAEDDRAVAEIYAAKGRPQFNPLIVHVADAAMAARYATLTPLAKKMIAAFWPGPLTLVLPRRKNSPLSLLVSAGLDTVALRMPAHPVARAMLRAADVGVAAPSANRSGRVSPTQAKHVLEELGGLIPLILDGGPCEVGIESTVIDCTSGQLRLLRPGGLTREMLEAVVGKIDGVAEAMPNGAGLMSPGMLESHYAPSLPVRLNVTEVRAGEALLAFGPAPLAGAKRVENLSEQGNLKEAAARLFAALRALDDPECSGIAVMPIPEEGLGAAINDRLKRAAVGR